MLRAPGINQLANLEAKSGKEYEPRTLFIADGDTQIQASHGPVLFQPLRERHHASQAEVFVFRQVEMEQRA